MKSTLRLLFILLVTVIAPAAFAATPTAASLMSGLRQKMVAQPAVDVVFTINGGSGPVHGSATIAGASFIFTTPQLRVWYDGKTQWTYLAKTREVSITEPTAEELTSSNPFAIINSYQGNYRTRRLSDSAGRYRVELVPTDAASPIKRIVLFIGTDSWPAAITVDFDDSRSVEVVIDKIDGRGHVPSSTFVYNAAICPASEIIDLR